MSLLAAAGINLGRGAAEPHERTNAKTIDWGVLRRVLGYTRPYAMKRNVIFALTLIRAAQKPALAWTLAAVINGPISGGDYRGTLIAAGVFAALALFTELTFHFRQRLALELGESVVHDLRNDVFRHLQRMPLGYYTRTKLGRILGRVITDIESIRRGVQNVFFFSLLLVGQMIGAAALMLHENPVLFLLLVLIGPLVWITNRHFQPRLATHSREVADSQSRLTGSLAESIKGMRVIQSFSRQERNNERFGELVDDLARRNMMLAHASSLYVPLLDANSQVFMAAMLLVGGWGALHGVAGMDVASLVAFLFLPALFFQSLQHLAQLHTQVVTSMAGAERVFRLLDEKPDWTEAADSAPLADPRVESKRNDTSQLMPGARVEFHDVNFGYEPERPVLRNISLQAEPGEMIALVGETGSGKSTLVSLLAKFYPPWSGSIMIDGQPLARLTGESLRAQMGIVPQNNFLFTGTVMENIRLGRPEASEAEVREAARALDCLDLLEALPRGLETEVGERGASLSLGQRQLICFTRAMLADPRIVVLDEATSAVDTITESRLQRALQNLLAGRTSFVIAHRLSTIRRADQILVLDDGKIIERGTHEMLLRRGGRYQALYRQFVLQEHASV